MKKIEFKVDINASAKKVWDTMLDPVTYKEWVQAAWPGSYYEGKWEQGEQLRFLSPGNGGTKALLVEHRPYEYSLAKHVAVIQTDGSEDTTSEQAKGWIGTTESYTFTETNGKTELKVEIHTKPEWASMFDEGWPKSLNALKAISER